MRRSRIPPWSSRPSAGASCAWARLRESPAGPAAAACRFRVTATAPASTARSRHLRRPNRRSQRRGSGSPPRPPQNHIFPLWKGGSVSLDPTNPANGTCEWKLSDVTPGGLRRRLLSAGICQDCCRAAGACGGARAQCGAGKVCRRSCRKTCRTRAHFDTLFKSRPSFIFFETNRPKEEVLFCLKGSLDSRALSEQVFGPNNCLSTPISGTKGAPEASSGLGFEGKWKREAHGRCLQSAQPCPGGEVRR